MTEIDKPSALSIGSKLRIDARHTYADLDELIASHIKAMARKVEEMMAHEKYKGTKDSLRTSLSSSSQNPVLTTGNQVRVSRTSRWPTLDYQRMDSDSTGAIPRMQDSLSSVSEPITTLRSNPGCVHLPISPRSHN